MLDYALAAQNMLGHEVRIFVPAESPRIVRGVKANFDRYFEVVLYDRSTSIACDALYVIKKGTYSRVSKRIPELNHAFSDASNPEIRTTERQRRTTTVSSRDVSGRPRSIG